MTRRLLLDSNALLWWIDEEGPLAPEVRAVIEDAFNEVAVSAASIWELSIAERKGRIRLPDDLLVMLDVQEVAVLDITAEHGEICENLPPLHHDPFDRMIVAQALHEDYVLVTADRQLEAYGVPTLAAR